MLSTIVRASGVPNLPFVCPSNCNNSSGMRTETMAESPSRTSLPSRFLSLSFKRPTLRAYSLNALVQAAFIPASCVPPSLVRTLLTNDMIFSE